LKRKEISNTKNRKRRRKTKLIEEKGKGKMAQKMGRKMGKKLKEKARLNLTSPKLFETPLARRS